MFIFPFTLELAQAMKLYTGVAWSKAKNARARVKSRLIYWARTKEP